MRLGKLGRKIVEDRKKQILLNNLLKTGIKLWTRKKMKLADILTLLKGDDPKKKKYNYDCFRRLWNG